MAFYSSESFSVLKGRLLLPFFWCHNALSNFLNMLNMFFSLADGHLGKSDFLNTILSAICGTNISHHNFLALHGLSDEIDE